MSKKAKPKLNHIKDALYNSLEEKFEQLDAFEKRINASLDEKIGRLENFEELLDEKTLQIQEAKVEVNLLPFKKWEKSFKNTLTEAGKELRKQLLLEKKKNTQFYRMLLGTFIILLVVSLLFVRAQSKLTQVKADVDLLEVSNYDLIKFLESEKQVEAFDKWLEVKYDSE